jgi:hypothetical protein
LGDAGWDNFKSAAFRAFLPVFMRFREAVCPKVCPTLRAPLHGSAPQFNPLNPTTQYKEVVCNNYNDVSAGRDPSIRSLAVGICGSSINPPARVSANQVEQPIRPKLPRSCASESRRSNVASRSARRLTEFGSQTWPKDYFGITTSITGSPLLMWRHVGGSIFSRS